MRAMCAAGFGNGEAGAPSSDADRRAGRVSGSRGEGMKIHLIVPARAGEAGASPVAFTPPLGLAAVAAVEAALYRTLVAPSPAQRLPGAAHRI